MDRELHLSEAEYELMMEMMEEHGFTTPEEYLRYLLENDNRTPEQHAKWRAIAKAGEGDHSGN